MRPWTPGILGCLLASAAVLARAQELDLQRFLPPAGRAATHTIPEPALAEHGTLSMGLTVDYAHGPLDRVVGCDPAATTRDSSCTRGDRDGRTPIVADATRLDLSLHASLFDALGLGVAVPVVLVRAADDPALPQTLELREGLGDLRVRLQAPLTDAGVRSALMLGVTLPTATRGTFSGERSWTVQPAFAVAYSWSQVTLAGSFGYQLRRRRELLGLEQDDELALALGVRYEVLAALSVVSELRAALGLGGRGIGAREAPAEVDLGLRLARVLGAELELGVGTAAWPSMPGDATPRLRLFAVVRSEMALGSVPGGEGGAADACPFEAEDRDGFADDDGCPDVDNDADGLLDAADACPLATEDRDGYQDRDGCPEPDNDADAVEDGLDRCAYDPEDRDGYQDVDGCPEPGPLPIAVTIEGSRILLSDRIYFDDGADTIRGVSLPVLDKLAAVLAELPVRKHVRVVGHTDDLGEARDNVDLSYRRARAVVHYLVAHGVAADRLVFEGRGASEPLAPNDTPEGRALNRRVEVRLFEAP